MKLNFGILTKLSVALLLFFVAFVAIGSFAFLGLRGIFYRYQSFNREKDVVERVVEESFLLLGKASNNLTSVLISEEDPETISESEDSLAEHSLKLQVLFGSLVNGSDSDAFKKLLGGAIYEKWKKEGYDKKFGLVPRLSNSHRQTV